MQGNPVSIFKKKHMREKNIINIFCNDNRFLWISVLIVRVYYKTCQTTEKI